MQVLLLLKLFGERIVQAELADVLRHRVSTAGYAELVPLFQAGADGAKAADPNAVAQAITDLLFSIK